MKRVIPWIHECKLFKEHNPHSLAGRENIKQPRQAGYERWTTRQQREEEGSPSMPPSVNRKYCRRRSLWRRCHGEIFLKDWDSDDIRMKEKEEARGIAGETPRIVQLMSWELLMTNMAGTDELKWLMPSMRILLFIFYSFHLSRVSFRAVFPTILQRPVFGGMEKEQEGLRLQGKTLGITCGAHSPASRKVMRQVSLGK